MGTCVLRQARPLRRYEIAHLSRQLRIADVENSQSRIKIRNVDQIARLLHRGIMDFLIGVVWSKASALLAKIFIGRVPRRHRRGKNRIEARLFRSLLSISPAKFIPLSRQRSSLASELT